MGPSLSYSVMMASDPKSVGYSEVHGARGIEEVYDTTKDPTGYGQRAALGGR